MKFRNFLPNIDFKHSWRAFAILITGIFLTVLAMRYTKRNIEVQAQKEFALVCNEIAAKIETRLHAHAQLLRSSASFFAASDTVTRNEWKTFIGLSQLKRNLPGILGVGFSLIIPKNQLKNHIQTIRNEGFPDYTVKPAGDRETYTSIIFLEPFMERNLRAFGYDMYSDAVRRKAMEQARDLDVAALSGKVTLVQETEKNRQEGTLMYVPVYHNGVPVNTLNERRAAIIGWVYSPYRMCDLMNGILAGWDLANDTRIDFRVYDTDNISANSLLFDSQRFDTVKSVAVSTRTHIIPIEFNGKKWTLLFFESKEQFPYFHGNVFFVFIVGIVISVLLYSLSLSLFNTSYRAQKIAGKLTLELKESEEKHRRLIENSHDIIYTLNADGVFIFVSPAWTTLLGHPVNEVAGRQFQQFVHPDDLPVCFEFLKKVIESEQRQKGVEYRVQHANGTWFWHTSSAVPLRNEAGRVTGFEGTARDITERKLAEDLLRQTHENYETFFNTIDEFLFVLDIEGNIIHTNSTVIDRLGFTSQELLGKSVLLLHPADRRDEAGRIVGEMLSGISEFCPVPLITKSGVQIPVETRVSHGTWDGKNVLFGVTKDISKVKLSEEKFSKLFHLNPSACGLSDMDNRTYVEVNEAFYTLLGFDKNEVIGKTGFELGILTHETVKTVESKLDENGKGENIETKLTAKNGDIKQVLLSAEIINVQDKKYRFTVAHDITWRKLAQEEIENKNKILATINAEKDRFFSIIAHDLRGPFNGFLGLTKLMADDLPSLTMEEIQKIALAMQKSATNLFRLLENLLLWARIQQGLIPFKQEMVELLPVVDESIDMLMDPAKNKGIEITGNIEEGLIVFTDINILQTVIRNLVSNAVKFTPKGGKITVSAKLANGNDIEIIIKDTGIGMSAALIDNLFRLDAQANRKGTEGEPSTGLGLIICKDFIEKHGGRLFVESTEGKGSTFSFTIPSGK